MPSLKIGTCCAPILLSFLRSLTDDQWRVIQHGMKNNLTFEQLSMLCLKIVKVVTQTALRILLPALARIMGVNLRSGATSPESQCSLTGSEDSLGSLDEREKKLLISEMNYWTKERRRNGSAGSRQKSTRRTSSPCCSPKRSQTSLQSLPATREAPLMEDPLKALFGVTEESLLISLVEGHSNPTSSSSSELSCAIVGEVVHQLNSGLSVAIQASPGSCPPMDSQDIAAGKEVIRVASVQILAELQSQTSEPEWVGFIEPLMDPVTDDVLDAIVGTMDKMAQDFNILLDLAKKMTILGSKFLTNLQCDLDVECPSGKEGTTHFLKETGSSTSVVARKLQTLSSPDFQSKALKAVSTILTRKVSSSSGMAPSSRPSSAAPSLTEAPLNTSCTALTSVTSTATVIVKAFVGGMETIASFEGTCEAVDWPVPVNDHKTGSSQMITFSLARTLYGRIRAKLRDLLTLSTREEGVAKDASLQESSDTLEKATVSTVEVQLPSTELSRVPRESQPIPALCRSNLDTSTQEVLSSVFSIYKSELSKVESKSLAVVSSSDESLEACWFVDGVLSKLDDYTISQSPSPNEDLSVSTQYSQLSSEESVRITESSTSLIQSIKKLFSNDFQTQAEEAVSKVLMRSSHSFITQISHTGLQKSLQAGLSSSSPSEIHVLSESMSSMSSENTASGLVETFVKGMATIFQKNESTDTVLLERSGRVSQCSHGGSQLDDTELSVKISEEKLWSTAKTICVSMKNTLKDFFTGLKPSGSERTENASSKETLGEILVAIQSEISNLGRMKDSRELLHINDMVGTILKEVEKSEDDSEQVYQDNPRTCSSLSTSLNGRSSLSSSSKGPRSECELEINLPGTPIPDQVPFDLTCPIVRSSCIDTRVSKMPDISSSDLKTKMMAHTDEPLHRNSPMTDSSRPPSAKASFRSSTPSFTSKGTSLVPKEDGIDIEEKEECIPSSSGHLRELLITPDISSATAFPLQYLMDPSKDDDICFVTILVIRLLSKIRPSALDGPSQQAADMTETSQQLIRQVLSEFCAASRFSRTQAYSQNLYIHRVFRGVHQNLMEEFGSYNTLQAAISSQDPAFDRVLVKSLTQQLVQGCKEASRPASAATNPLDQAETERGAEQKARRSFLCFSMTKLRINFKRSKRGNKKDCHSVQEQTEIPSTDGHCIAPVGEVSPSIPQLVKKRSLIVRVFSAMMKPFRRFTKKNL
ncbi:serine-rich adhesin for platelets-like [Oncorhynchus clarkii lewisi]|uniref:serine-rich adhesin for platelets-like n=1 Tax=Oncorhynchus clarkii lewisi TaxID=490388 RepID=UPI0039B84FFD